MPEQPLFTSDESSDRAYINMRCGSSDRMREARDHCEQLWEMFEPHADANFCTEFRNNVDARYWEMYLAVSLMEMGFEIECPKPGPDVGIEVDGQKIWFEATSPTRGQSADQVPEIEFNTRVAYAVPNERMILRYLNSIEAKIQQSRAWLASERMADSDCYIIAINPRQVPHDNFDSNPPRILQAAYHLGSPTVTFDRRTGGVVGTGFEFRREIERSSGSRVPTGAFENPNYRSLSGLLCSRVDVANRPTLMGEDFQLAPNPNAAAPLPNDFRLRGTYFATTREANGYTVNAA